MHNKYKTQSILQISISKDKIINMYKNGKTKRYIFEKLKKEKVFNGCFDTFINRLGDVIPELKAKKRTKKRGRK